MSDSLPTISAPSSGAAPSFDAGQIKVLELVATGTPLEQALEAVIRLIEAQVGTTTPAFVVILLFDQVTQAFTSGISSRSTPPELMDAILKTKIGPNVGSCGTAIFRRERVVTEDISIHPAWDGCRHVVAPYGIAASWSTPIFVSDEVVGTFALYYRDKHLPSQQEIDWVDTAIHLASIAIGRDRSDAALRKGEARAKELAQLHTVSSNISNALIGFSDVDGIFHAACRLAVEGGLAIAAWVGARDEFTDVVRAVATYGHESGYVRRLLEEAAPEAAGDFVAHALATGEVSISNEIESDASFPHQREALERGFRSAAAFPLRFGDAERGVFVIYAAKAWSFRTEEVRVLTILANHLAVAVEWARRDDERQRLFAELRQNEEQLRQAQKMEAVGQLAGGIAHDFNNLLAVILSYATLIAEDTPSDWPLAGQIEEVRKAAQRAGELTRQLLTFSRQQMLEPRVVDLNRTLDGLERMMHRLVAEDVTLTLKRGAGLGHVRVDPGQIDQVILNLVVNACDAMPRGGRLTIETVNVPADQVPDGLPTNDYVMLAVRDTGHGIDAATRSRIFEPFFTTKPKGKGTGLGLAMVYGFVTQSGGQITVASTVDVGTAFSIYLPRVEAPLDMDVDAAAGAAATARGTERILVVEDVEQVRRIVKSILERAGYQVLVAENGVQALRVAGAFEGDIDLVLTDVVMPQMSGSELAERLEKTRPQTKVLYMSGYTEDSIVDRGVIVTGIAYLAKPFTPETLLRRVRDVLDRTSPTVLPPKLRESERMLKVQPRWSRLLYLDDEEQLVVLAERILGKRGYSVRGFTHPETALEVFAGGPAEFDVLVTDVSMFSMSGYDFVVEARKVRSEVPIIMTSGHFDRRDQERAAKIGVEPGALILKPGTVEALGQAIDAYIQKRSQEFAELSKDPARVPEEL